MFGENLEVKNNTIKVDIEENKKKNQKHQIIKIQIKTLHMI